MSNKRYVEPVITCLFNIVQQHDPQDEQQSKQMAKNAKDCIDAIQELQQLYQSGQVRNTIYQRLSHIIKFDDLSLEARDENGSTFLTWACANNHTLIVQALLTAKADPNNAIRMDETPLLCATRSGNVQMVQALLEAKAYPDKENKRGMTPILSAVLRRRVDVVNMLLHAGAKIDFFPDKENSKTALEWAIFLNNLEMTSLLLSQQAAIRDSKKLFEFLMSYDPRDPDVLLCLNILSQQQNTLRQLNLPDAKLLDDDQYQTLERYRQQLSKVCERLNREALNPVIGNILIPPLIDMIGKLDAPLYRLNNSPALFSEKQVDEFREQLAEKYKEICP